MSRMVSQIINKISSSSLIPLQEVMVLLTNLHLVQCSEVFNDVSLFTTKLVASNKSSGKKTTNLKNQYMNRDMVKYNDYSFFEFFHLIENGLERHQLKTWRQVFRGKRGRQKKMHILRINGRSTTATYPPTENKGICSILSLALLLFLCE